MSDKQDLDLDAIVRTASSFSPSQCARFMQLIPPETREIVWQRLKENDPSKLPDQEEEGSPDRDSATASGKFLPPTVIVEPSPDTRTIGDDSLQPAASRHQGRSTINLIKLHARGAVGDVFVAFEDGLSRELALKRIRNDLPPSEARLQRFIREAEITANLQHPGIVPIYELEVSAGSAHYTMPLVSGSTLSELIRRTHEEVGNHPGPETWKSKFRPLLTRFIAVCNAVDYAHSQKVIHRDLKPDNIMIGTQGQTLVLDWGCAKRLDDPSVEHQDSDLDFELASILGVEPQQGMTVAGSVMGTIAFMSPEQASGIGSRVGTASDIFGLGATLFNLLTNEVAYRSATTQASSINQALEDVSQGKHRKLEDAQAWIPPAMAAICNKAMAFEPQDRYETAAEMGRDIDAFLAGEIVSAYPEPLADRGMRFIKRYRTAFATLLGTVLVGLVSLALLALMIDRQRERLSEKNAKLATLNSQLVASVATEQQLASEAIVREKRGKQLLYETEMLLASEASTEPGGFGRMRQLVDRWNKPELNSFRGWEWRYLDALGNREFWKADLNATANRVLFTRDAPWGRVFDLAKSVVYQIDTRNMKVLDRLSLNRETTCVDFNRDQSVLAIGLRNGVVQILKLDQPEAEIVEFKQLKSAVTDIRWNIGGDYLAACDASGELAVWQWYERELKYSDKGILNQANKRLLAWSYDGKDLCWTTGSELYGIDMAEKKKKLLTSDGWILNPCWSHEGELLAYIGPENTVVVKNPETDRTTRLSGHQLFVESLRWHPGKHYLLTGSADGSVRVWNVDTEKEARQITGHGGHVYAASWNSDGSQVVSGGLPEDQLHVWDVSSLDSELDRELQNHPAFDWHPDGVQLAVAEGKDILIQSESAVTGRLKSVDADDSVILGLAYNSAGDQIACVSSTGRIWTVDAQSGQLIRVYDEGNNENLFPEITGRGIDWSANGKYIAGVGSGGKTCIWDQATGEAVTDKLADIPGKTLAVTWSPLADGKTHLAFAGTDNWVHVFDPARGKIVKRFTQYGWTTGLAWSPDEMRIAASDRRSIVVWDVASGRVSGICEGPSSMIRDLSWSPSQGRLAALAEDGMVCFWNDRTYAFCARFELHNRSPWLIRWSPDGNRVASTARHGRLTFQSASIDSANTSAK